MNTMKFIHCAIVIGLILLESSGSSQSVCYDGGNKRIKYKKLNARCSATEGIHKFECQNAIDGNKDTYWIPDIKVRDGSNLFYTIILKDPVYITRVQIAQYIWPHGRAELMSFDFGNGNVFRKHFNKEGLDEFYLDYPVEASQVTISIDRIEGVLFGGFIDIVLRGCLIRDFQQQTFTEFPLPETPDSDTEYSTSKLGSIIGASVGLIIALILFGVFIFIYLTSKKKENAVNETEQGRDDIEQGKGGSSSSSSSYSSSGSTEKLDEDDNPDEIKKADEAD